LDYALLERLLQVIGPSGAVVGTASIEDQETRWRFTPGERKKKIHQTLIGNKATISEMASNCLNDCSSDTK